MEIDNYFFPAEDLNQSMEFYKKLGLPVKFDFSSMGMAAFQIGNGEPAIILKDKKKFPNAKPAIWFVVEDVLKEVKKLRAEGVTFLSEPFPIHTGMAVEFEDPSGNRLGLTDYAK